jgi:hypothetical protein
LELDLETQLDYVIELALPWYIDFYVSWYEAGTNGKIDVQWISYEEMIADWNMSIRRILDVYGIKRTDAEIEEAIQRTLEKGQRKTLQIRLNKGVVGRGNLLSDAQKERVRALTRFYPWVDFSRIL